MSQLADNIRYLRKKMGQSQQEMSVAIGVARTTVADYERGHSEPNITTLIRIAEVLGRSVDDLVRHKITHEDYEVAKSPELKVLAITVDAQQNGNIELVESKAEAGYLSSFQDPEYIKDLPKIHFPNMPDGTYRGFEIHGDSMLPLVSGSIVICSYVERLEDIKDYRTYVVVSKSDGLVYKRVRKDLANRRLILISDNDLYLPYELDVAEIAEIWQYHAHIGFSDTRKIFDELLAEKLNDIQRKVSDIHDILHAK